MKWEKSLDRVWIEIRVGENYKDFEKDEFRMRYVL